MALFKRPKYATVQTKTVTPQQVSGEWFKCKSCSEFVNKSEVAAAKSSCTKCGFYYPLTAGQRIDLISDSFEEIDANLLSEDVLGFDGYTATLEAKKSKTKLKDAVVCGFAKVDGQEYGVAVMDFRFMGGSLGSVVGEKITRLIEASTDKGVAVLLVTASGGARMQEGALSLMQMAKTSAALARHDDKGLPFIGLLTNPTYGGVTASYASLGDIILAEPKAMIGFAGARVIETTIKAELPEGFQTSEFLVDHGLVDRIVERESLKSELSLLLSYFQKK